MDPGPPIFGRDSSATPNVPVPRTSRRALCRRPYVLVETEEVRRIVLVLQGYQPLVVCAVCLLDPVFSLFSQVVDVDPCLEERLHRLEERTRPLDILFRVGRIGPLREDEEVVVLVPMPEGRRGWVHTAGRSMHLLEPYTGDWGGHFCNESDHDLDRLIAQMLQPARLPVMLQTERESHVGRALERSVRHRLDVVF